MRGATAVPLQPHQILRLSRRKTHMLHPHHIWNLIYNAQSNRCPQPPQILRLTQKIALQNLRANVRKLMKRHFQCGADPSMIRARSEHETCSPQHAWQPRLLFELTTSIFYCKIQRFAPNLTFKPFTKCCTCHEKWHLHFSKYCTCHEKWHLNFTKCCTCHEKWHLPRKVTLEHHQVLHLPRKVTLALHQVLHLPRKVALELHPVLHLPRKVTLALHQVLHLPRKVTLDLHQVLHLPRKVTPELHQELHLPRKVTLEHHQVVRLSHRKTHMLNPHRVWHLIYNVRSRRRTLRNINW